MRRPQIFLAVLALLGLLTYGFYSGLWTGEALGQEPTIEQSATTAVAETPSPTEETATVEETPQGLAQPTVEQPEAADDTAVAERGEITVVGHGEVQGTPDLARLSLGVETQEATAQEALQANNQQMSDLLSYLEEQGIAEADVQTLSFHIRPRYERGADEQGMAEVSGYVVRNVVEITVRDLDSLGSLLDGAINNGANAVNGVQLAVVDSRELEQQARELALEDAQRKAQQLAQAAGVELGPLVTISTPGAHLPPPVPAMGAAGSEAAVPIETGQRQIRTTLQVTYEIR